MEAAQRSAEYVFQGIMYYFRREKVCPRYQFTLKDPVDPALLQQRWTPRWKLHPITGCGWCGKSAKPFWNRTRSPALSTRTA